MIGDSWLVFVAYKKSVLQKEERFFFHLLVAYGTCINTDPEGSLVHPESVVMTR